MSTDLEVAYTALSKQATSARTAMNYYNGVQPLMYTLERLREVFDRSTVNFIQNWCAVVVDTTTDRIVFKGWDNPSEQVNDTLDIYYRQQYLQTASREVHRDAVVTGDGFLMADTIDGEIKVFRNSPRQCAVLYSDENPYAKVLGIKTFKTGDITKCNLYYPEHIEKYEAKGDVSGHSAFKLVEDIPNPFGVVPIIHFTAQSDLLNVIPIQDAINKTFSDMMVVAEFNAFRQRWMVTNADISSLKASPQSIMRIPKGSTDEEGTMIGEFEAANLGMYLDTIDKLTNAIAVISRTPKHYFANTGANISGEALVVMESPLIKKCQQYVESFSESWVELANLIVPSEDTVAVWDRLATEQLSTNTQAMQTLKGIGIPLITVLRRFGWGEDEVAQMLADMEEEKGRKAELAAAALEIAEMRLARNNEPYNRPEE